MEFNERIKEGLVIFDGAIGTQIQELNLKEEEWHNFYGCNEYLNLIRPELIIKIHQAYLEAGADVIETNSFGANISVLEDYGLADKIIEINREAASLASKSIVESKLERKCYVAGSIGPGTKLISLGQVDFDSLYSSYSKQVQGLLQGGVDLILLETCQDILQIKCCLLAVLDQLEYLGCNLPIIVSVTVESNGTLLLGTDIGLENI